MYMYLYDYSHTQTMSEDDFRTILACLMRVCWSSAAGKLHLATGGETSDQLRGGLCASAVATVTSKVR